MNIAEIGIVCSGLALVREGNEKFIADIGDIIRHNLKHATGIDLILLTKGSYYMRNFKYTTDLYTLVHAEAMSKFNQKKLDPEHVKALSMLFESHKIITDSPFVQARVQR